MKVLISDNLSPVGVEILKKAGLEVDARSKTSAEEIEKIIGDYDALIIRSATKVTAGLLEKAAKLKIVGRAGSGLDNVDTPAATKKGVVVMNTPGGNTVTTAEHTIGMIFACARMIPQAYASLKAGKWEKKKFEGVELYDKTLGVVGLGAIGGVVANRAIGIGMKVLAFDPFISTDKAKSLGIELADLTTIYKRSDFITVHTPKTKETANLINKDTIALMKDGVRIINCARGGIVNEQDLYEALKSGKVAAAAFEVFEKEPPAADAGQFHRDAAPRRLDAGSAGEGGRGCGRAGSGLPRRRDRTERGQRPLRAGRPAPDALAVHQSRGTHGSVHRPAC
jgi:D-3-phosphoglycerate dehydrogenase